MKSILIPVEESELLESVLETALLVARRFGSHMEGLHVRPDFAGIIAATGMGAPYVVEDFRKEDWESIQRSRLEFEQFLNRNDIPLDGGAGTGQPWATFRVEAPPGDDFIGQHARLFDVTVLGQPSRGATPPRMSTLEAALFDGGRAVLVAPPTGCAAACVDLARELDLVWQLFGRNADHVDILWLGDVPDGAVRNAAWRVLEADPALRAALPRVDGGPGEADNALPAYVVDPNGFVILRYAPGFDPGHLRSDMARLLKLR